MAINLLAFYSGAVKPIATGVIAGLLAGSIAFVVLNKLQSPADEQAPVVVRDIVDVPKMSTADAEQHREDRFRDIHTIEDTLALPTDFVQTEALYVLAGRSDSAAVQDLIYQTNRVASPGDRAAGLGILFLRLAEIDPQSALAMSRTEYFSDLSGVEQQVWRAWARMELDGAIAAAKTQNRSAKNVAAQVFYSAYGYMGNDDTDRIEAELGIPPSRAIQMQYINKLARENPRDAIDFVNDMRRGQTRDQLVSMLGSILAKSLPNEAAALADYFDGNRDKQLFSAAVGSTAASNDPEQTLRALMSAPRTPQRRNQINNAMNMLATTDLDKALLYYQDASPQDRQHMIFGIARELVQRDPAEAIEWSRNNNSNSRYVNEYKMIIGLVAQFDPRMGLEAATAIENRQERRQTLAQVLIYVANTDHAMAVDYLAQIDNKSERSELAMQVIPRWARDEPEAALAWLESNDGVNVQQIYSTLGMQLVQNDVNLAMQLLPRIPGDAAKQWRAQIVATLASNGSINAAGDFARQFEDEDDYDQLQAALISGVAQEDVYSARNMAGQMPDSEAKTAIMRQLLRTHAQQNPADAATWLNSMTDPAARQQATAELARQWARQDADSAERWANRLPTGAARDMAIANMASNWQEASPSRNALLKSIANPEQRANAEMAYIFSIAGHDLQKARNMLVSSDLSSAQRDRTQMMLDRIEQGQF